MRSSSSRRLRAGLNFTTFAAAADENCNIEEHWASWASNRDLNERQSSSWAIKCTGCQCAEHEREHISDASLNCKPPQQGRSLWHKRTRSQWFEMLTAQTSAFPVSESQNIAILCCCKAGSSLVGIYRYKNKEAVYREIIIKNLFFLFSRLTSCSTIRNGKVHTLFLTKIFPAMYSANHLGWKRSRYVTYFDQFSLLLKPPYNT